MSIRFLIISYLVLMLTACNQIKQHNENILSFDSHGFTIELDKKWKINKSNELYDTYLKANKKYHGEKVEKRLKNNSSLIFQAVPKTIKNKHTMVACFAMKLPDEYKLLNNYLKDAVLQKAVNDIYERATRSKYSKALKPEKLIKNGKSIFETTVHDGKEDAVTQYKVFIAKSNIVICSGISYTKDELTAVFTMLNSIWVM